jgi:hypothetical protein
MYKNSLYTVHVLIILKRHFLSLLQNKKYFPFEVVKNFMDKCDPPHQVNFSDADLLCILNFIIQNITLFTTKHSDQTLFYDEEHKIDPSDLFKSFKTEAHNHNVYTITQPMERWNDKIKKVVYVGFKDYCVPKSVNASIDFILLFNLFTY